MWATKPGDDAPWSRSRRWKLIRCTFQGDAYLDVLSINITQDDMIEVGSDHFIAP